MELYKVLVVDDEEEIRNGIIRKIDWKALGFLLSGSAENGQEALDMAEKLRPDVVMTDVKMPFMTGLELGERLKQSMPATKLVIFSGFDDFEYAQRAIKMNAMEYILKPIDAEELSALLKKIKKQLDDEFAEKRNSANLREHYNRSLPIMRQQLLARLVEGRVSSTRAKELAKQYQLNILAKYWAVCIIHSDVNEWGGDSGASYENQSELLPISIHNIVDESLDGFCDFISFLYNEEVVVLAKLTNRNLILQLVEEMNKICIITKRFLEVSVCAGVGPVTDKLNEVRRSYEGALTAVGYRVLMGGRAIYIGDVEPDFSKQLRLEEDECRALLNAIKLESSEQIQGIVQKLVERLREAHLPINQYQIYLSELAAELIKMVRAYNLDTKDVFGSDFKGYFHLTDYESLEELREAVYEICNTISLLIKRERMNSAKLLAERTRTYIQEHYMESDLSVETMCGFLHVSPAYFSTIFKRETGVSFIIYLTNIRMEEAIRLLDTTSDKTYAISAKVGYTEPNYFSYVFKKHFGVSPSKYRSKGTQ